MTVAIQAWVFDAGFWSAASDLEKYDWTAEHSTKASQPEGYDIFRASDCDHHLDLTNRITAIQLTGHQGPVRIETGHNLVAEGKFLTVASISYDDIMIIDGDTHRVATISAQDDHPYIYIVPITPETAMFHDAFPGQLSEYHSFIHTDRSSTLDATSFPIYFVFGTEIMSAWGEVPVEDLQVGDMIMTRDNGLQPIRWIRRCRDISTLLAATAQTPPIRIETGALGHGLPRRSLVIASGHRILVRSRIAQRLFGSNEVLVAAEHLLPIHGIDIAPNAIRAGYVHLLLDSHQLIFANGAEAECSYTNQNKSEPNGNMLAGGGQILSATAFQASSDIASPGNRPVLTDRQGKRLAIRHAKNRQPLIV